MDYKIDDLFKEICKVIVSENKSLEEWIKVESDDMFQNDKYIGGFDADEMEFCFSMYENNSEYWFQVSLDDINNILNGNKNIIELRPAINT